MFYDALNSTNEEQQRMVGYVLGDILFGYLLAKGAGKVADVAGDFSKGAKAAVGVTDGKIILKGQYADDAAKYLDDLADGAKYADDVADGVVDIAKIPDRGFSSFDALKKHLGKADEGYAWHHIVEQSQIQKSGFTSEQINNVRNVVQIPSGYSGSVHSQITGRYATTKFRYTNGLSVRDWLANQSFEVQFEYGLEVLREFGTLVPTEAGWIFIPFN